MGTTPLKDAPFPRGFLRLRLERAGCEPVEDLLGNTGLFENTFAYHLPAPGEMPEGMARLPGGLIELTLNGLDPLQKQPLSAFLMDRFEVTNQAYKAFLDAGGYGRRELWPQPFMDNGKAVPWDEAMRRFTDRTGRPGPSTWETGAYPDGAGDLPVTGVSWYEAAAYAAWAGKRLPTLYHWNLAACTMASSRIVPMANLAAKGLLPVGRSRSLNRYGIYDLAGNAREWVWNATSQGRERFILGGAWNDAEYAFSDTFAQPTFDRSATNGFRCIRYLGGDGDRVGRAVWWPIYKSTYERGDALHSDYAEATTFYKDHVVMWAKDLSRSLDYLETRKDLDASRTLYYGLSWGASLGAILPAVEPRIRANILYVAGLGFQRALPEAEAINYIGHVRQPTLMLDGELDFWFPAQTSQKPMFNLLGTPPEHKKWKVYPGGHSVPRTEEIKESLEWMDRYLGPVSGVR